MRTARAFLEALDVFDDEVDEVGARAWLGDRALRSFLELAPAPAPPPEANAPPRAGAPSTSGSTAAPRLPKLRLWLAGGALLLAAAGMAARSLVTRVTQLNAAVNATDTGSSAELPPSPSTPSVDSAAHTPVFVSASLDATASASAAADVSAPRLGVRAPSSSASSNAADPRVDELAQRLTSARTELAAKGLSSNDLPSSDRSALERATAALSKNDAGAALSDVDAFAAAAHRAKVDATFVRAKLDRVSARIRDAKASGADTTQAEARAATALQAFLDGRYDATNAELDAISSTLPK